MADPLIEGRTDVGYVDWASIWLGAGVAVAISVVLSQFGSAADLGVGETMVDDTTASWQVLVAALWLVLMALSSSLAGGYLTGRLRRPVGSGTDTAEREFRDGAHGIAVWAIATVATAIAIAALSALTAVGTAATEAAASADVAEDVARYQANGAIILGFGTAAAAAVGAAAAWFASELGGKHRDSGTSVADLAPRFLRKR